MDNGFLQSTAWAIIKVDLFMLRGQQCEMCGRTTALQVHHLTYDRYGGNEVPEDLIILCGNCHMRIHGLRSDRFPMSKTERKAARKERRAKRKEQVRMRKIRKHAKKQMLKARERHFAFL